MPQLLAKECHEVYHHMLRHGIRTSKWSIWRLQASAMQKRQERAFHQRSIDAWFSSSPLDYGARIGPANGIVPRNGQKVRSDDHGKASADGNRQGARYRPGERLPRVIDLVPWWDIPQGAINGQPSATSHFGCLIRSCAPWGAPNP